MRDVRQCAGFLSTWFVAVFEWRLSDHAVPQRQRLRGVWVVWEAKRGCCVRQRWDYNVFASLEYGVFPVWEGSYWDTSNVMFHLAWDRLEFTDLEWHFTRASILVFRLDDQVIVYNGSIKVQLLERSVSLLILESWWPHKICFYEGSRGLSLITRLSLPYHVTPSPTIHPFGVLS